MNSVVVPPVFRKINFLTEFEIGAVFSDCENFILSIVVQTIP